MAVAIGFTLGLSIAQLLPVQNGPPPPAQFVTSINAEGWSAEATNPGALPAITYTVVSEMAPDTAPITMPLTRAGFDASGAAVSYPALRIFTKRKQQAWTSGLPVPNYPPATASTLAMDDYVYATDGTPINVTNNSTEISPKPIAAIVTPSRMLVGNTIGAGTAAPVEVIAFHRDCQSNRQVACVKIRANDGTTQTPWVTIASTKTSTTIEDANPVEVYELPATDISALATGPFWLEFDVRPWLGADNANHALSSILRSEDNWAASTTHRTFTRRYFHKDVARAAAPPLAYVDPAGNDSTGIWSTNAATAQATPFLTATAAHAAIMHATRGVPATGGLANGCRIRIAGAVNVGSATAVSNPQGGAGVVIERAPGVSRASAVLTMNNSYRPAMTCSVSGLEPHLTITDLTLQRTSTTAALYGEAATIMGWQLVNMRLIDTTTGAVTPYTNSNGSLFGVAIDPGGTMNWLTEQNKEVRLLRGVTADLNGNSPMQWVTIGCSLSRVGGGNMRVATEGCITYSNKYLAVRGSAAVIGVSAAAAGDIITGVVALQNVIEITGTGTNPAIRLSADNANGSIVHLLCALNVVAGFGGNGRENFLYDESTGTNRRQHRLMRFFGNIWLQINTKGSTFVGVGQANPTEAPLRTGNSPYAHGVGCEDEWSQFCSADGAQAGSSFSQMHPGLRASIGNSLTVRNDPLFVNYQAATSGPTAGAGGGDYRLQAGSGARGRVRRRGLAYDLAGAARPTSGYDACGAYV